MSGPPGCPDTPGAPGSAPPQFGEDEVQYEFNVGAPRAGPDPFAALAAPAEPGEPVAPTDPGAGPADDTSSLDGDDAGEESDADEAAEVAARGREMAEGLAEHLKAVLQVGLPALLEVFGRRAEQMRTAGRLSGGAAKRLARASAALGCGARVGLELRRGDAVSFLMAERAPAGYHVDAVYAAAAALAGGESDELTRAFAAVYAYVTAAYRHAMADGAFAAAAAPLFDGPPPPLLSADRASGLLYVAPGWDGIGCQLRAPEAEGPAPAP